jgi:hypothetical protein
MTGAQKIEAYLEAVAERDASARAVAEEGATNDRKLKRREASDRALAIERTLTGGQLAEAKRRLAALKLAAGVRP